MRKIAPLIFSVFAAISLTAQTTGGWGTCQFATVATMNALDPSTDNLACKKAFVSATNEHYKWDGTSWVLEGSGSDNIYTTSDTLTANRVVTLDGNDLTFEGTNNVFIQSDGKVGINTTTPGKDIDINGTAHIQDSLFIGSGQNLELQHNGTNSEIINNTGDLYITDSGTDDVILSSNGGNVGIGNTNPAAKLDVDNGTVRFSDYGAGTYDTGNETYLLAVETDGDVVEVDPASLGGGGGSNIYTANGSLNSNRTVTLGTYNLEMDLTSTGDFNVLDNGTQAFTVKDDGLVGIGNITPVAPLHIYEATGTAPSATDGTIVLEHGDSGGQSSIVFKSNVNSGDDYAYISYSDDGSGNGFNAENSLLTIAVQDDIASSNRVDDIAILPSGSLGVGTISPDARLDVEGGSVRFSDYGSGTYMDTLAVAAADSAAYMLGVDTHGDVVEMNTAKSSKIFYPPALVIDVSSTGTNLTLDLHQEYVDLFSSPAVASSGAPSAIPTYDETELYYYVTDYDSSIFSNLSISAAGVLTYDIDTVPSDNCAILNVVFVVK